MNLFNARNQRVPFLVDDIDIKAVAGDFDPYNSGSPTPGDKSRYLNRGFLVRPDTNGAIKVVTYADYKKNSNVVVDLNAVILTGCVTSKWEEVRVVKVFAADTDSTNVMIGILP